MYDHPGIDLDDLPWIHRDQFVHYLTLAHALGSPADWVSFRHDLTDALTAAFGLHCTSADGNRWTVLQLLDRIHSEHDPAIAWPAFLDTLWSHRREIRPDL